MTEIPADILEAFDAFKSARDRINFASGLLIGTLWRRLIERHGELCEAWLWIEYARRRIEELAPLEERPGLVAELAEALARSTAERQALIDALKSERELTTLRLERERNP